MVNPDIAIYSMVQQIRQDDALGVAAGLFDVMLNQKMKNVLS
jgi:hypothetical protein